MLLETELDAQRVRASSFASRVAGLVAYMRSHGLTTEADRFEAGSDVSAFMNDE